MSVSLLFQIHGCLDITFHGWMLWTSSEDGTTFCVVQAHAGEAFGEQ